MTEIAKFMNSLAQQDGFNQTTLSGVNIFKASEPSSREPLCYGQGVIFVGQGAKRVFYGGSVYEYNPDNYLVLPVPIPAECETFATADEPMLAMMVDIDVHLLGEIFDQLENHVTADILHMQVKTRGLYVSPVTTDIDDTVGRLLRALCSPMDADVLGSYLVRELFYRILLNDNGMNLLALTMKNTDLARIDKALRRIHTDYRLRLDVNSLAAMVNMSASTFHRTFKEVTSTSPIQYIKKVRLAKAKTLLVEDHSRVSEAAAEVGYESATQFSREFKRYFGRSPVEYSNLGRKTPVAGKHPASPM